MFAENCMSLAGDYLRGCQRLLRPVWRSNLEQPLHLVQLHIGEPIVDTVEVHWKSVP